MNGELVKNYETVRQRKDGQQICVSLTTSPFTNTAGKIIGVSTIARDISERINNAKELAEIRRHLERANVELKQFAYVAAHDLQEPLRTMTSYTHLLAQQYRGTSDKETETCIGYITDAAARMQALIRDLLSYGRVDASDLNLQLVDCSLLFDDLVKDFQESIGTAQAQVTCDALPVVLADHSRLALVFRNLLSNALKFQAAHLPIIHVSAKMTEGNWEFSVKDNGIGIESQYFERIFRMFQRLHTMAQYPGTGIGLAICKKVVELHHGRIWIESEVGAGTTVFFTLPAIPHN